MEEEIHCGSIWCDVNFYGTLGLIEETASLITSESLHGSVPPTMDRDAHAVIFQEPLGVILGIAPWNAPLILAMRAVIAAVAMGNTAILKGSELSPRTHFFTVQLFQDAGFPPGVVNFLIHRAEDAVQTFDMLITSDPIRKCNFTGSTAVGRAIAQRAGAVLKPVLLELGGKNCAIVLPDADLDKAARTILFGATLNNGQICMSTDHTIVHKAVATQFRKALSLAVEEFSHNTKLINTKGAAKIQDLAVNAKDLGATTTAKDGIVGGVQLHVIDGVTKDMRFYHEESFGPMLGIIDVETAEEAVQVANSSGYGLSCSIWTKDQMAALRLAKSIKVGAVHVNASTVHDEQTLPHGGCGNSGYGRFGAVWGLKEFVQTKTVILHAGGITEDEFGK